MESIILESDCLEAIQACRGEIILGEIHNIVQDICNLRSNFQRCGFTWVARVGNSTAHHLAQLAQQNRLPLRWTFHRPPILQAILNQELHLQQHTLHRSSQGADDTGHPPTVDADTSLAFHPMNLGQQQTNQHR